MHTQDSEALHRGSKQKPELGDQSFRAHAEILEMPREAEQNYAIVSIRIFDFSAARRIWFSSRLAKWRGMPRTLVRIITYVWLNIIIGSRPRLVGISSRSCNDLRSSSDIRVHRDSWLNYAMNVSVYEQWRCLRFFSRFFSFICLYRFHYPEVWIYPYRCCHYALLNILIFNVKRSSA